MARKNMSLAKKLYYHDENKAMDNTYDNNSNYQHYKNPSLSVMSENGWKINGGSSVSETKYK